MKSLRYILIAFVSLSFFSCNEKVTDVPLTNKPPKTSLWLYPDSSVGVGISRQRLHWWGEDPDGVVRGFLFAFSVFPNHVTAIPNPDTLRYSWLTSNDTLMAFPLDTLFRNYTVFVRAVDNSFRGLPVGSIVRFQNGPYWDKNDNKIFDAGDEQLPDLVSAADAIGAVLTFPIRNTPPTISFARNPNDVNIALKQPDTTFTVVTFAFKGSDFDGDNTLTSYRIALNDTSNPANWVTIGLRDTIITLVVPRFRSNAKQSGDTVTAELYSGVFNGARQLQSVPGLRINAQNKFYVQAKDVAGEYSQPAVMPSGTDRWFVKKPLGRILLVSDYIVTQFDNPIPLYVAAVNVGPDFDTVDVVDFGRGLTTNDKSNGKFGSMVSPFVDPALIRTFLLYDYVLWYTDKFPSTGVAQLSIFNYLQKGGKVIFSANFSNSTDPRGALRDFAPIDSIDTEQLSPPPPVPARGATSIAASTVARPDSSIAENIYPRLAFSTVPAVHSVFMRPLYRRADAKYIYHLEPDLSQYLGSPNIGVIDGQRSIVFMGVPLHLLNNTDPAKGNPEGVKAFFRKVLTQQFSASHKVDRRKF